jgi:uncharacterized protein YqhQ
MLLTFVKYEVSVSLSEFLHRASIKILSLPIYWLQTGRQMWLKTFECTGNNCDNKN